jgi:hypothetical protein
MKSNRNGVHDHHPSTRTRLPTHKAAFSGSDLQIGRAPSKAPMTTYHDPSTRTMLPTHKAAFSGSDLQIGRALSKAPMTTNHDGQFPQTP